MKQNVLLKTVHGSRLYGLSGPDSDWDYYEVVDENPTKKKKFTIQRIIGGVDTKTFDLSTWLAQCNSGVPQALEAMFSDKASVDKIPEMRQSFYFNGPFSGYTRTIEAIYRDFPDSYKHKRHMLRLGINMKSLRGSGRFNPELSATQVALVNSLAKLPAKNVYNDALALAWS